MTRRASLIGRGALCAGAGALCVAAFATGLAGCAAREVRAASAQATGAAAPARVPDTAGPALPAPAVASAARPDDPTERTLPTERMAIVTDNVRETDYRIGADLARLVAAPVGIRLDVRPSKGSSDNLRRLVDDPSVDLALVQYDVLQAVVDQAARGNAAAERIVRPLRVLAPLYTQEFYFVVRADSPLQTVDQIADATIGVGPVGSGSALSTAALYRRLFDAPLARDRVRYLDEDRALVALTVDRSIDVAVVVAGQPTRLFDEMRPEARRFIRLLRFDATRPSAAAALAAYFPATIRAGSYPSWLDTDVPTLSVMSFLVTKQSGDARTTSDIDAFARSLCARLAVLRADGHPKWREVDLRQRFGRGWRYASAFADDLAHCAPDATAPRRAAAGGEPPETGVPALPSDASSASASRAR